MEECIFPLNPEDKNSTTTFETKEFEGKVFLLVAFYFKDKLSAP